MFSGRRNRYVASPATRARSLCQIAETSLRMKNSVEDVLGHAIAHAGIFEAQQACRRRQARVTQQLVRTRGKQMNVRKVRETVEEVFGRHPHDSLFYFITTTDFIGPTSDLLLWQGRTQCLQHAAVGVTFALEQQRHGPALVSAGGSIFIDLQCRIASRCVDQWIAARCPDVDHMAKVDAVSAALERRVDFTVQ